MAQASVEETVQISPPPTETEKNLAVTSEEQQQEQRQQEQQQQQQVSNGNEEKKQENEQQQQEEEKKSTETVIKEETPEDRQSKEEEYLAKCMMALALDIDKSVKWQSSSSANNMRVDYAYVPPPGGRNASTEEASLATVRASTTIQNFQPSDFYEFTEGNNPDEFAFYAKNDVMCEEIRPIQVINNDKLVVYARFNTGGGITSWLVWNRDFCYIRRRFFFRDLVIDSLPNGKPLKEPLKFKEVCIGLCTSVSEKDPVCKETAASHVRGEIKYAGYCFFKKNESDTDCRFVYVINIDPKGWLPAKVVDIAAPQQAKVAVQVKKNIGMIRESLRRKREQKAESEQQT